jgi:signal peptidase II
VSPRKKQVTCILIALSIVLIADQVTKIMVVQNIEHGGERLHVRAKQFFWLTHERNPGLVNGMFRDKPLVALAAPILASLVLVYLYRHLVVTSIYQAIAYGMVAGGAAGNLIDRVFRGEVVDFLQLHFHFIPFDFPWKLYPAFNLADSAICVGVVLLIFSWHRSEEPDAAEAA